MSGDYMKEIGFIEIKNGVSQAIYDACHNLNEYTMNHLLKAKEREHTPLACEIMQNIIDNANLAREEHIPMCQDTGIVTCFAYIGYDVHLTCDLYEAINAGVKDAYEKYYLRKSVANAITRINTKDNTPAIVHVRMVPGNNLRLILAPKGAGSENMSKMAMLNPTDGIEGIKKFVVDAIKAAGGRPCPPLFLGIGIGGNFETCCEMAKEALMRTTPSIDPQIREIEEQIKAECNKTFVGPMGLGGETTVFEVFVNSVPCHIASLPVALNIQCHANRHQEVVL